MKIFFILITILSLCPSSNAFAVGEREALASLVIPTTGQTMNGEYHAAKTKTMASVEVASLAAISVLSVATSGLALVGLVPLAANHAWSSMDAYQNAKSRELHSVERKLFEARRKTMLANLDKQKETSDLRARLQVAKEKAYQ